MPFTPFHFGINSCIALGLQKYLDFPVFILVNVVVDIEPLVVMLLNLHYPLHGYCHTLLVGSLVGVVAAVFFYSSRSTLRKLMNLLRLDYNTSFRKMLISAILGIWFHVLLDATLYSDIRPFYPFRINPLYGIISYFNVYLICTVLFIPGVIIYIKKAKFL